MRRSQNNLPPDLAREDETPALFLQGVGGLTVHGLKAVLAEAPLEGIDLERPRNGGRAVDL